MSVAAMACPEDDLLVGLVENSLQLPQRQRLEHHVDRCPPCRATVGHLAAVVTPTGPRQVGRYRLDAELGRGGMGVVWRAWDPALEREVAVKLLHPELDDERWRQRALREARALARLQHPNVIAVHDVGQADDEVFIATELIDGEPLEQWQRQRSPREILDAYAQAARGLAAAHAMGLVHRDVKPSNILVSRSGRVCIGDFGLATTARASLGDETVGSPADEAAGRPAKVRDTVAAPLPTLTVAGQVLGTPAYMAPEQQSGGPVDAAADQYALCRALAEALLGKRPADGASAEELARSGVPAPWTAIARGLAVQPTDRFANLEPLIAALEATQPSLRPEVSPRPRRRSLALLALGATAIAGGTLLLVRSGGGQGGQGGPPSRPAPGAAPAAAAAPGAPAAPAIVPLRRDAVAWIASATGPWRLPMPGRKLVIADANTALVTAETGYEQHKLMTVDLRTGATASVALVAPDATLGALVRIKDQLLAFGTQGGCNAAWRLTLAPLRATALTLPAACDAETGTETAVAASPDGGRLILCGEHGPPTVRDARTLDVLHQLPGAMCETIHFSDSATVTLDAHQHNLKTGAMRNGPVDRQAGPGGRVLTAERMKIFGDVRIGNKVVQRQVSLLQAARWTPDGVAIGLTAISLNLRPGPGGKPREEMLRLQKNFDDFEFDVDATRAVVLSAASIEVIDLQSGSHQVPAGNLGELLGAVPYDGTVIAASDAVRTWSQAGLVDEQAVQAIQLGRRRAAWAGCLAAAVWPAVAVDAEHRPTRGGPLDPHRPRQPHRCHQGWDVVPRRPPAHRPRHARSTGRAVAVLRRQPRGAGPAPARRGGADRAQRPARRGGDAGPREDVVPPPSLFGDAGSPWESAARRMSLTRTSARWTCRVTRWGQA
jgi:predicted Ser/Thr protein kinase